MEGFGLGFIGEEDISKAASVLSVAIGVAFENLAEAMKNLARCFISQADEIHRMSQEEYWDFVPPKVRHLAFHHRKARIRRKNWNRMWRILERRNYVSKIDSTGLR